MTDEEKQRLERLRNAHAAALVDRARMAQLGPLVSEGVLLVYLSDLAWAVAQLERLEKAEPIFWEQRNTEDGYQRIRELFEAAGLIWPGYLAVKAGLAFDTIEWWAMDLNEQLRRFATEAEAQAFVEAEQAKEESDE